MGPKKNQERRQRTTKRKRQSLKEDSDEDYEDEQEEYYDGEDETVAKKGTKSKGSQLQQKSPAEFFADNKNIAGFDNVCMYV